MCQPERLCMYCKGGLRALPFYLANGKVLMCGRCLLALFDKAQGAARKSQAARRDLESVLMVGSVRGKR